MDVEFCTSTVLPRSVAGSGSSVASGSALAVGLLDASGSADSAGAEAVLAGVEESSPELSGLPPEASVTAVRVRSIVRAALQAGIAPDAVMSMAAGECSDDEHFVTAIVLVLDAEGGALSWCNAGHHPAIVVTREALAHIPDGGRIINIVSELVYLGRANTSVYVATKAALLGLTRAWARELAPRILVNAVAPGPTDTPLLGFDALSDWQKAEETANPMARIGRPEEVAKLVAYLASDAAAYITGAAIPIDGGDSAG